MTEKKSRHPLTHSRDYRWNVTFTLGSNMVKGGAVKVHELHEMKVTGMFVCDMYCQKSIPKIPQLTYDKPLL